MIDLNPGSEFRKILNREFLGEDNKQFRDWYFNKYNPEELKNFKNQYYDYMTKTNDIIFFVRWFINNYINNLKGEILVLQKTWQTSQGETVSRFPPEKTIFLNTNTEATAYLNLQKVENAQVTLKELNSIIRSQNYTNTYLNCLGDQLISVEQEVCNLQKLIKTQIEQQKLILEKINKTEDKKECNNPDFSKSVIIIKVIFFKINE